MHHTRHWIVSGLAAALAAFALTAPAHAAERYVMKFGTPTVKRAYGDWTTTQLAGWKKELLSHAIQPMQQFAYTKGKGATDRWVAVVKRGRLIWMMPSPDWSPVASCVSWPMR